MQYEQKSFERKEQLSNIIEEKSEVHNISSIKPPELVQNLQINQQVCFLCEEPDIEPEVGKPLRSQNILIYPCLCNKVAHRDCMKIYLVQTQTFFCEICKANYAVGKSSNKILTHITPTLITSWLGRIFVYFAVIVIIVLLIIYVAAFSEENEAVASWKTALFLLFGLVLALMIVYMILVVKWTIRRLKRCDIEVYCNQTEIALHSKNPRKILQDYYDNAISLMTNDQSNLGYSFRDEEGYPKDVYNNPTNMSFIKPGEGRMFDNRRYPENEDTDNIMYSQEEQIEPKIEQREQKEIFKKEQPFEGETYDVKADSEKLENIGKVWNQGVRKNSNTFEEFSTIKADFKGEKNNESLHSVGNVINELEPDLVKKKSVSSKDVPTRKINENLFHDDYEEEKVNKVERRKLPHLKMDINEKKIESEEKGLVTLEEVLNKEESLTLNEGEDKF